MYIQDVIDTLNARLDRMDELAFRRIRLMSVYQMNVSDIAASDLQQEGTANNDDATNLIQQFEHVRQPAGLLPEFSDGRFFQSLVAANVTDLTMKVSQGPMAPKITVASQATSGRWAPSPEAPGEMQTSSFNSVTFWPAPVGQSTVASQTSAFDNSKCFNGIGGQPRSVGDVPVPAPYQKANNT